MTLDESTVPADPLALFDAWLEEAFAAGIPNAHAMALATATPSGAPSARFVLLKSVEGGRFVFFTNVESRKARELDANPRAALCFYWAQLGRQVRVEGTVERTSCAESEAYFRTRPRASRIGAWASPQSEVVGGRLELERRVTELEARFPGEDIPLPPFWGGYRVEPHSIEFWVHQDDRLHDRLRYTRVADGWRLERLAP